MISSRTSLMAGTLDHPLRGREERGAKAWQTGCRQPLWSIPGALPVGQEVVRVPGGVGRGLRVGVPSFCVNVVADLAQDVVAAGESFLLASNPGAGDDVEGE